MKAANLIFSLMLLFLACYPCSDATSCADEKKSGKTFAVSNHEHSPDELDLCSPFCICSCCSTQINQPAYFYFEAYCPLYIEQHSNLIIPIVTPVAQPIWQPPKLA